MPMTKIDGCCAFPMRQVTIAETVIRDLGKVSEWGDLWGKKLNVNKTKSLIFLKIAHNASAVTPVSDWWNCAEGVCGP